MHVKHRMATHVPRSPRDLEDWEGGDREFWEALVHMDLDYVMIHCDFGRLCGWRAIFWAG